MPESPLRLIKRFAEFRPKDEINLVPRSRRGLYVLYLKRRKNGKEKFDVVYVGMTISGIRARLRSHRAKKGDLWTHFTALRFGTIFVTKKSSSSKAYFVTFTGKIRGPTR